MATQVPVTFKAAPLPFNFSGTPQQFLDAVVARLSLESGESIGFFVIGSTAPTSNVGPWLKNGTTWYVWNVATGAYVAATVEQLAPLNTKPFRGNMTAPIIITLGSGPAADAANLVLTEVFDPDAVFSGSTFTAPENGIYHIDAKAGVSANVAPTGAVVTLYLKKNGTTMANEIVFGYPSADATGRVYTISTDIQLAAGDTIVATVSVSTTGGAATTWTISQNDTFLSGFKVKSI